MADDTDRLQVICDTDQYGDKTPQRFCIGKRAVEVLEILDRWLAPEHRYFKLRGDDGGIYILRHATARDVWEITLYDSGQREDTRLSST